MIQTIKGAEYPLSTIFSSTFEYHIPTYQRPYAWTKDQASELFDDLYEFSQMENTEPYFLGSIVLIKEENKPSADVVDGQQRLTTLTILFAAIISSLQNDVAYHNELAEYVIEPGKEILGREKKPRLMLRERDQVFFERYVQGFCLGELDKLDDKNMENDAQLNIKKNAGYFIEKLSSSFNGDVKKLKEFASFIVTRCFLIVVSTPSQKSAFRIFSVMNNRGLDLQPTDIFKADIIGKIEDKNKDEYSRRWEEMENTLGRDEFNTLFSHIRMIYAKEKAKRSLLEEFREHVIEKYGAETFVDDILTPYADAMEIAKKASYKASSNAEAVNECLVWLNRIDNSDWMPAAILFLSKQKNNPKYAKWFLGKLERLSAYLHVCGKNVNERIMRYKLVLDALETEHSLEKPVSDVNLFDLEIEEMKNILSGEVYWLTTPRRRYVILRLDSFISDKAASYDTGTFTIEHVLPQTISQETGCQWLEWWPDEKMREEWTHKLANLVPLNKKRNSAAQNYNFKKKKEKYFAGSENVSSYALTSQVLNMNTWNLKDLEGRQKKLTDTLIKKWDLETTSNDSK